MTRPRLTLPTLVLAVVLALGCEDPTTPTAPPAASTADIAPAATLAFRQVSAGGSHTCGVTTTNVAYCWGGNSHGQLGTGTRAGGGSKPMLVAGGLAFRQVSVGGNSSCGVTTSDRAYCWGQNNYGQVGDGTKAARTLTPVPVAGGLAFARVSAGGDHACGVTTANVAYCWGKAKVGQLGDGTQIPRLTPTAVAGGLAFRGVNAGFFHTCGVTTANVAYCWGENLSGQLGDGTNRPRTKPVRVAGGLAFNGAVASGRHSCGATTANVAYCWGSNSDGQLGSGTSGNISTTPVPVAGGLAFRQVNPGALHTCGVTTANVAYCWGANLLGQLGDGTTTDRLTPVPVAGGLSFRQVSAGGSHTCGVTTSDAAYCWSHNDDGQLGDHTLTDRLTPVPVR